MSLYFFTGVVFLFGVVFSLLINMFERIKLHRYKLIMMDKVLTKVHKQLEVITENYEFTLKEKGEL